MVVEGDKTIDNWNHAVTGLAFRIQRTCAFRIDLHEQEPPTIVQDRHVRIVLLKEPSILHYRMQLLSCQRLLSSCHQGAASRRSGIASIQLLFRPPERFGAEARPACSLGGRRVRE